jgi:hypothetical protein
MILPASVRTHIVSHPSPDQASAFRKLDPRIGTDYLIGSIIPVFDFFGNTHHEKQKGEMSPKASPPPGVPDQNVTLTTKGRGGASDRMKTSLRHAPTQRQHCP